VQAHPEISALKARLFLAGVLLLGLRPRRGIVHSLLRRSPSNDAAALIARHFLQTGEVARGTPPSSLG
jgi:hypothetical protein